MIPKVSDVDALYEYCDVKKLEILIPGQGFLHASDFVLGNDFCDLTNFFSNFFLIFCSLLLTYIFPFGI